MAETNKYVNPKSLTKIPVKPIYSSKSLSDVSCQAKPNSSSNAIGSILDDYHTKRFSVPEGRCRETSKQRYFKVNLVEISSPSSFLFTCKEEMFQTLRDEMNVHYGSLEKSGHLAIRKVLPRMSVAVYDESQWQRAEVLCVVGSRFNDSEAFMYFVDIGVKKYVKIKDLRYLAKSFASISRACHKGSLFGVTPKDGERLWNSEAILEFISKTKGKSYAMIRGQKDGIFQLSLVHDTASQISIGNHLIKKKLADPIQSVDDSANFILVSNF